MYYYSMSGDAFISLPASLGWSLAEVGDFDGDNRSDLLLRDNQPATSWDMYFMSGTTVSSSSAVSLPADANEVVQ